MGKMKELENLIRDNLFVSTDEMITKISEHFDIPKEDVKIELVNNHYDYKIKLPGAIDSLNVVVSWEVLDEKNL